MPLRSHILVLPLLLLTAVSVRAATEDQAAQLHKLSGLEAFIDSYPAQMRLSVEQQSGVLPPLVAQVMRRAVEQPADLAVHHDAARRVFRDEVSKANAEAVLAWLRSPLGSTLTRLEVERGAPDAMPQMMAYAATLERSPPSPRRLGQVRELMELVNVETFAEQAWLASAVAIGLGVNAALPEGQRQSPTQIREQMSVQIEQLSAALMEGVVLSMLFAYDPVADDEMDVYLGFQRTPPAQAFNDTIVQIVVDTLGRYSYHIGLAIAEEIRRALSQRQG